MDKYFRALDKHKSRFTGLPNVCGIGVGYKRKDSKKTDRPALIIFVEKKEKWENLSRGERIPKMVGGLETDVIEIGKVRLLGIRQERVRPAQPGVSLGHFKISAGTFGAVVKDAETGEPLILSNNHILANGTNGRDGRAKVGDPILQPGGCDTILNGVIYGWERWHEVPDLDWVDNFFMYLVRHMFMWRCLSWNSLMNGLPSMPG